MITFIERELIGLDRWAGCQLESVYINTSKGLIPFLKKKFLYFYYFFEIAKLFTNYHMDGKFRSHY